MLVNTIKKRDIASFTSNQADLKRASAFVNLNDRQLRDLAYVTSYDKKEQKKQDQSVKRYFKAIPIVDTLAVGVLAKKLKEKNASFRFGRETVQLPIGYKVVNPTLGERASVMGKQAAGWGAIIIGIGIYNKIKKAVVSKSPALQEFEQNNPGMGFVADIGILIGGYFAGSKALKAIMNRAPKLVEKMNTLKADAITKLDKTKFSKKTLPIIEKRVAAFAKNNPKLAMASGLALANSMFVLLGLGMLKSLHNAKKNQDKVEATFGELKEAQLQTAKRLAGETCESC